MRVYGIIMLIIITYHVLALPPLCDHSSLTCAELRLQHIGPFQEFEAVSYACLDTCFSQSLNNEIKQLHAAERRACKPVRHVFKQAQRWYDEYFAPQENISMVSYSSAFRITN